MRPLALVAWKRTDSPSLVGHTRRFLSEADEHEVLNILHEHFRYEQHLTSDDVRFVVRSVASQSGAVDLPPDFPPVRWILDFKRVHGFSQLAHNLAPEYFDLTRVTARSARGGGSSDDERGQGGSNYAATRESSANALTSFRAAHSRRQQQQQQQLQQQQQQQQQHRRRMVVDDHRAANLSQPCENAGDTEEVGSNTSSGSENGTTTGASSSSSGSSGFTPSSAPKTRHITEASQDRAPTPSETRSYKLSHTVPAETWEKAIAAVEQQGMSLRAAAKIYGVHFAALHRRVKKRAQRGQTHEGTNSYFHPSDEAGIMRVVVAYAELGVLMTFTELMKLVESAALRKLPNLSVDDARKLMVRFQSRNEHSIRHIIDDWPPPLSAVSSGVSTSSNYYLEHPGYDYGMEASTDSMRRSLAVRSAEDSNGPTTTPSLPTQFGPSYLSHSNGTSDYVLPRLTNIESPHRSRDTTVASSPVHPFQLLQRVPQAQDSSSSRPLMFV